MKTIKAYPSIIRTSIYEKIVAKVDATDLRNLCGKLVIELKNGEVKTINKYHSPKAYLKEYGFVLVQN